MPSLDFLKPRSIAVVGASRDPAKRGYRAIKALIDGGYTGRILPINPKESEILGFPCYRDLAAAPDDIDLALVCTPARAAPDVIASCGARGVRAALLLAGGFSEAGPDGAELEARTMAAARQGGVRVIGPNTAGIFDAYTGCNLVGWPGIYAGKIGVLCQSGNVAIGFLAQSQKNGHAGFTTFVGVGNEGDIRFDEYLRFYADDPNTGAVIVYVEGFKDGPAFLAALRELAVRKPVVVYKAGRTDKGEGAARSHSGSLAGNYAVAHAALQQAGAIVVERSDEVFAIADMASRTAGRPTRRVAILSEGGGPISQAVDALTERGLDLPRLSTDTEARLKKITPNATQLDNPVDAGGGTDPHPRYFPPCSEAVLADPSVDALLIVGYFGGYQVRYGSPLAEAENKAARELVALARQSGKPVVVQCHYAEFQTEAIDILRAADIVVVRSIELAAACLAGAERFHQVASRPMKTVPPAARRDDRVERLIAGARSTGRHSLLEPEALELLAIEGIATPPFALLRGPADAGALSSALTTGAVALKIVSKDILHKSDVGGVRLGVLGRSEIETQSQALLNHIDTICPNAEISGVLASPMAAGGVEVIIGVTNDPQFGPVLMFGIGGVYVEILKDVVFRTLPIDREDAEQMVDGIRGAALLKGARGRSPIDREKLVALLQEISRIALAYPELREIDLNPVILHADGFTIVDARMLLG